MCFKGTKPELSPRDQDARDGVTWLAVGTILVANLFTRSLKVAENSRIYMRCSSGSIKSPRRGNRWADLSDAWICVRPMLVLPVLVKEKLDASRWQSPGSRGSVSGCRGSYA
jgi:hypothetical protein